ncbi:Ankyrin repeat and SOCS box protein 7 [Phytophthora citrophthora]|uniref:Ankyrin repeat and SOCS box protein 7 n=1 Tax=Phytophthora citrophthora TaxID=4793 RepID=A0AAD9GZ43_9STRA|nr:Ankyrin repeat and SOCS box protein 7 [Phytophthora citrophthora]
MSTPYCSTNQNASSGHTTWHFYKMTEELQEAVDGFFLAAEYGRSDVIKALADHGRGQLSLAHVVDPVTGRSPLHVAVASGKKDALRVLLAAGFPPQHQSNKQEGKEDGNRSAYTLAQDLKAQDLILVFHQFLIQQVAANDVTSVNQLLEAGVDVGVTDAATGGSLLHWAASCQAVDVMKILLEREDVQKKELVNTRNGEGATPLHLACHSNQVECTRLLLLHGADARLKGEKGISKDKMAIELAIKEEVKELFTQVQEKNDTVDITEHNLMEKECDAEKATGENGEAKCGFTVNGDQQGSETCPHEIQNGKLQLQLEEKDLLVNQLKKTIEALVQESQEIQMLGENRVMLDYVRKLRDEKAIVQRQLEDANDYIKVQQQQLVSLKEQIRQLATADKQLETDHDILSHISDGTVSSVAGGPPDSTHSDMSILDLHQLDKQIDEEDDELLEPQAQPLKLDAWTSKAQREQETFNRYVEKHGPDIWSTVWNGIWTGNEESEAQDEDGEVIMTV